MIYKVPMPSRANGFKLHTFGDHSVGIEYTTGEPHVGKMAFDSQCGILAKNISFRKPRPDLDRIVADAERKVYGRDGLPPSTGVRGATTERSSRMGPINATAKPRLNEDDNDDDNNDAMVGKLMVFLKGVGLETEDLERVQAILNGGDEEDADEGRRDAADRARDRGLRGRRERQLAADQDFARLFPDALRILNR